MAAACGSSTTISTRPARMRPCSKSNLAGTSRATTSPAGTTRSTPPARRSRCSSTTPGAAPTSTAPSTWAEATRVYSRGKATSGWTDLHTTCSVSLREVDREQKENGRGRIDSPAAVCCHCLNADLGSRDRTLRQRASCCSGSTGRARLLPSRDCDAFDGSAGASPSRYATFAGLLGGSPQLPHADAATEPVQELAGAADDVLDVHPPSHVHSRGGAVDEQPVHVVAVEPHLVEPETRQALADREDLLLRHHAAEVVELDGDLVNAL